MKKFGSLSLSVALLSTALLVGSTLFTIQKLVSDAAVSDWQKGASIIPQSPTDYSSDSFKQSVRNLKNTGANSVSLILTYWQPSVNSTDIEPAQNNPTDQSLIDGINYIHSLGMQVMLKPHVEAGDNAWRAFIDPTDRTTWYKNYSAMLNHLGDIGKQTGVETICIGTELIDMSAYTVHPDNTQQWITMINSLRTHYSGTLTYSANWGSPGTWADEKNHIGFWSNLDVIGISGYYALSTPNYDYPSLKAQWEYYRTTDIEPLYNAYKKPIIFTEVGYESISGAHTAPYDYRLQGSLNLEEQANDYDAFFRYWDAYSYIKGAQLWDWKSDPNAGGASNTDYTPQNKIAQTIMTQWFGGVPPVATSTPTTTPPVIPPTIPPTVPPVTPPVVPPVTPPAKIVPTATTQSASSLTQTSATLNASVNMNGGTGTVWFIYGTNPNAPIYSDAWPFSAGVQWVSGSGAKNISVPIQNLKPNTTYYYRVAAENYTGGTTDTLGSILSFTTGNTQPVTPPTPITPPQPVTPPQPTPTPISQGPYYPTVVTQNAQVSGTSVRISGTVNMNGGSGHVWFEYGNNSNGKTYYEIWPWSAGVQAVNGKSTRTLTVILNNLQPHTTYYYRIMAENDTGGFTKSVADTKSFITP